MDKQKMYQIGRHVLKTPYEPKLQSEEFCGVYVHSGRPFVLEDHLAAFHSFYVFSTFDYPCFLFVSPESMTNDLFVLQKRFPLIEIVKIPALKSSFEYNQWMFNKCFYLIPDKYENLITFQDDSWFLKPGFESLTCNLDYIGAKWHSDIEVLSGFDNLPVIRVGNGGISKRKRSKMIAVTDYVNSFGGQHEYFKGIKINGALCQNNSWLAEDAMFCSVGFGKGFFEPVDLDVVDKFAHEPLDYSLAISDSEERPISGHKCDN